MRSFPTSAITMLAGMIALGCAHRDAARAPAAAPSSPAPTATVPVIVVFDLYQMQMTTTGVKAERLVSSPRVATVLGRDATLEQGNEVAIGEKWFPSVLTVAVVPRKPAAAVAGRAEPLDVSVTTTCKGPTEANGQIAITTDGPHTAALTVDMGATVDVPLVKCFDRRVTMRVVERPSSPEHTP